MATPTMHATAAGSTALMYALKAYARAQTARGMGQAEQTLFLALVDTAFDLVFSPGPRGRFFSWVTSLFGKPKPKALAVAEQSAAADDRDESPPGDASENTILTMMLTEEHNADGKEYAVDAYGRKLADSKVYCYYKALMWHLLAQRVINTCT